MLKIVAFGIAAILVGLVTFDAGKARADHVVCGETIFVNTILDSDLSCAGTNGIVIGADGITLDLNGNIISGTAGAGIWLNGHDDVNVRNGTVTGFLWGVLLWGSDNNHFVDLMFTDNVWHGIAIVDDSDTNVVKNCTVTGDGFQAVMINNGSDGNKVQDCSISGHAIGLYIGGFDPAQPPSNNNTVEGSSINNNTSVGIFVTGSSYNTIKNNETNFNGGAGIALQHESNNNEINNNISNGNAGAGIGIRFSNYNTIQGNETNSNIGENSRSIHLSRGADYNRIMDNISNGNTDDGINLNAGSDNNVITDNSVTANGRHGIRLWKLSELNEVRDNTSTLNGRDGINLGRGAHHNEIRDNQIVGNSRDGIQLQVVKPRNNPPEEDADPHDNLIIDNNISGSDGKDINDKTTAENTFQDNNCTTSSPLGLC